MVVLELASSPWQRAARHHWQVQQLPDVTGHSPGCRKEPPVLSRDMERTIQCHQPQEKPWFAEASGSSCHWCCQTQQKGQAAHEV